MIIRNTTLHHFKNSDFPYYIKTCTSFGDGKGKKTGITDINKSRVKYFSHENMTGKAKILYICLLVIFLSADFSSEHWLKRPRRRCRRIFAWRRCRKPVIPTARGPKTSLLATKATTTQPTIEPIISSPFVIAENFTGNHSTGLPYCKTTDLNKILGLSGGRKKRSVRFYVNCIV